MTATRAKPSKPQALTLDRFLPYRLALAASAVSRLVARQYEARFGLSIPEWRLIAVLGEGADLTQAQLTARTGMDKVAVSRAAARLARRGLILARPSPGDSRARLLALTEAGTRVYAEIAPLALETESHLIAALSAEEREAAIALLRRLEAAALALSDA